MERGASVPVLGLRRADAALLMSESLRIQESGSRRSSLVSASKLESSQRGIGHRHARGVGL